MKLIDIAGQRFGRWLVIERRDTPEGKRDWWCRCDCGTEKFVGTYGLKSGKTKSCGCLNYELVCSRPITHGMTGTKLHAAWSWMKSRVRSDQYSKRGIGCCDRWWSNFSNFFEDMKDGYAPGLTLERVDNDKGYSPENCIWASRTVQNRNRRPSSEWKFKEEATASNKGTGIRYIYPKRDKFLVKVKAIRVGVFSTLDEAIKAKDKIVNSSDFGSL